MNWFKPHPLFRSSLDLDIQSDWDFYEIENAKVWIFAFHFSSCVVVKQYCPVELLAYIEGFYFACYRGTGFDTELNCKGVIQKEWNCLRFANKAKWDSKMTVTPDTRNEEFSESEALLPIVSFSYWGKVVLKVLYFLYLEKMQHLMKPFSNTFQFYL